MTVSLHFSTPCYTAASWQNPRREDNGMIRLNYFILTLGLCWVLIPPLKPTRSFKHQITYFCPFNVFPFMSFLLLHLPVLPGTSLQEGKML